MTSTSTKKVNVNAASREINDIRIADLTTVAEHVTMNDGRNYDVVRFTIIEMGEELRRALHLANGVTMYGTALTGQACTTAPKNLGWARTEEEAVGLRNTLIDLDKFLKERQ